VDRSSWKRGGGGVGPASDAEEGGVFWGERKSTCSRGWSRKEDKRLKRGRPILEEKTKRGGEGRGGWHRLPNVFGKRFTRKLPPKECLR